MSQHTFVTLFEEVNVVEIPIIQRDYAQGREQAEDVRHSFLSSLRNALLAEDSSSLDLDFVYGSFEANSDKVFSLLDGQQRLTTLFLLHWYTAMREGKLDDFQARWMRQGQSRFTYATRPSAADFFNAFASSTFSLPAGSVCEPKLSTLLVDCNWFFLAWHGDPTVKSCLTMLDAIHQIFSRDVANLYSKLVDVESPRITFQLLKLVDFGLSDDLYIKMNARGKPLTPFENFKAWLVGHISNEPWAADFDTAMDGKWINFFWRLAGKQGSKADRGKTDEGSFDDLFLRFMYVMAYFEACNRLGSAFAAQQAEITWITQLRGARGYLPLRELENHNSFELDTIKLAAVVLNYFCKNPSNVELVVLQRALLPQHDYADLVNLYAIVVFVGSAAIDLDGEFYKVARSRWDRITSNLIANSRIGEPDQAIAAVKGIKGLAHYVCELYEKIANNFGFTTGFTAEQIREEAHKAALIIEDLTREALFREAEAHNYLQGRIGFLIGFSLRADSSFDSEAFVRYSQRARAVLSSEVLNSNECLLERALLSIDDYLVNRNGGKFSFCQPNSTAYRDRGENWLRVILRPGFRLLLDRVNEEVATSLRSIISASTCTDWRKYFITEPELIRYCGERLIDCRGSDIYLLSKKRRSGRFVELRSYALYRTILQDQVELGNVNPNYIEVYSDSEPKLVLTLDGNEISVNFVKGEWKCSSTEGDLQLPAKLERFIEAHGLQT